MVDQKRNYNGDYRYSLIKGFWRLLAPARGLAGPRSSSHTRPRPRLSPCSGGGIGFYGSRVLGELFLSVASKDRHVALLH